MNSNIRKQLLGALVGIGRSAESSAHLIDKSLDLYVLKALAACNDDNISDDDAIEFVRAINEEKSILVPDCSSCAAPCGRTDDYDMDKMVEEATDIINIKEQIVNTVINTAIQILPRAEAGESLLLFPFYRALYSIGASGWTLDDYASVINEIKGVI